jgi:transcriptional regulator with XRE-family HTH domain
MNSKIGNRLRELRKQKGFTQEEVCDLLKISQSAYARMEAGENCMWANYIEKICEIYNIKPEDLLKFDNININNNQSGGNSNNALVINSLSEKVIELYDKQLLSKDQLILELNNIIDILKVENNSKNDIINKFLKSN